MRSKYSNSIKEYKKTFGQLPPIMREQIRKNKLKKQVLVRRKFNLKHPKKEFNSRLTKNWGFLDKSTLIDKHKKLNLVKDARVYIKPVRSWRDPLKKKLVKTGRRHPSLRGLSKSQIKKIKKR